ncbi:conserved hypothetical protein [Lacticaseibacillus rhamnosus ATCC 8530]|nr:conserved hypothetical protein [Lacticaseibacillus rhamnosus ATCC 8530]CAR89431.1 Putative protein without homology [Lacticaseibacillus rhamnosus Lc 705]
MARSWPLRLRSLHADSCAGERVIVSVNRRVIGQHFHAHHNPISKSTEHHPS